MRLKPNFLKPCFVAITFAHLFENHNGIVNTGGGDGSSSLLSCSFYCRQHGNFVAHHVIRVALAENIPTNKTKVSLTYIVFSY
jgi:hypothetical protein